MSDLRLIRLDLALLHWQCFFCSDWLALTLNETGSSHLARSLSVS
jgi:hypothetical protein